MMNRRTFLKDISGGVVLTSMLPMLASAIKAPLRFGVITDIHYGEMEPRINRYYQQSLQKVKDAVNLFNESDLDFVIELGDLKDTNGDVSDTLRFLDDIEGVLQTFNGPIYHALGNHDMDCLSKEEFLSHTANAGKTKGRSYYSFVKKGVRFIVLDANFNEQREPYCRGNFSWKKAFVPQWELDWLNEELRRDKKPVIVFNHQMIDHFSGVSKSLCVGNAAEVIDLLERSGRVMAVIQGHHHTGNYSQLHGIHYWTMKAVIESDYPTHNSYAIVEIDRQGNISIRGFKDCESRELEKS